MPLTRAELAVVAHKLAHSAVCGVFELKNLAQQLTAERHEGLYLHRRYCR
jgi:hypothetical protein